MQTLITFDFTASGILPFYWDLRDWYTLTYQQSKYAKCFYTAKVTFQVLHVKSHPLWLYGHVTINGPPFQLWLTMWCPCYMCTIYVSGWSTKRAWQQILDIWPTVLELGPINDFLLFVTSRRWYQSFAKVIKRVKIEKSKLFFVIPKTIPVIPYPYNFSLSYPLSLKLFC